MGKTPAGVLATQYGTKFSDAFNKKSSLTGGTGVYGNSEGAYNSLKRSNQGFGEQLNDYQNKKEQEKDWFNKKFSVTSG